MSGQGHDAERARLASVEMCAILDTPREPAFDSLVFTAAQLFRVPVAAFSIIDADRVWSKAAVGPLPREQARDQTICALLINHDDILIIDDATTDARFAQLAIVAGPPHIRFYACAPVHGPGRHVIGALCILDPHPRNIPERQRAQLRQLAHELETLLRLRTTQSADWPDDLNASSARRSTG